MSNELSIPNVEVIENGQQVSGERMDPAIASFVMMAAQTAQLVKLRKLEQSKIPVGAPSFTWPIPITLMEVNLDKPWISFSLTNNGPGNIQMAINVLVGGIGAEAIITNGQTISRDFEFPTIYKLYFIGIAVPSTISIHAEEGEWA